MLSNEDYLDKIKRRWKQVKTAARIPAHNPHCNIMTLNEPVVCTCATKQHMDNYNTVMKKFEELLDAIP